MKGIERFVSGTLGSENAFAPHRKEWIATAIGAVGSLASSLFGGASASRAAREGAEAMKKSLDSSRAYALKEYNQDYVDTNAGQNLVRRAKEYARENWRKASGAQAVSGGTAAATQMAKDAGNRMVGDTLANVAATDQSRRQSALAQVMRAEERKGAMDAQIANNRAQQITNATQAASNAIASVGSMVDQGFKEGWSLKGGSNNSETKVEEGDPVGPYKTANGQ